MEYSGTVRKPSLPAGWYPHDKEKIALAVAEWTKDLAVRDAVASVSPHAGWLFSGKLAAKAAASLAGADTVAIIGGHLFQNSPILYAKESLFETVAGDMAADGELLKALMDELRDSGFPAPQPDAYTDNSVEVLLPLVAALQPRARVIWLRSPPTYEAKELGAALGRASTSLGKKVVCIGSTDLTHYGPAYGFTPAGRGDKAERWVRDSNDKTFIDALVDMNCETALSHAIKKGAACSPGAAVAALGFAIEKGATQAILLDYATSLDVRPDDSFVGYAAIAFR